MQRASTTVVTLVGSDTDVALARLDGQANVRSVSIDPGRPALDRAVEATTAAAAAHIPFLVHDADPLAVVADAWVRRFDESGPVGELEVACSETLARWRSGALELPDYYLVLDPETMPATRRHWYLGVLHAAARHRVVPVPAESVATGLASLSSGPWWPPMDELLTGIDRAVPDRAGLRGG
jgi:hypothetical protein